MALQWTGGTTPKRFRAGIIIDDCRGDLNIYVSEISGGKRSVLLPTQLVFSDVEEGLMVEPGIKCTWEYGIPLLKALRDAINRFDEEMGGVLG